MKDPAFLFYSSDFLTGTMLMTDAQVGKYIRLLCLQHQKGRLSEKDIKKVSGKDMPALADKFKKDSEGLYYNERLEYESEKRNSYVESRRSNRLSKAEDTKEHMNKDMSNHMNAHMENENINTNINNKGGMGGKKKFIIPTVEEVKAYCDERKNGIDAQHFIDSNEAKGWLVGNTKTPMKDWKAAVRTWENKRKEDRKPHEREIKNYDHLSIDPFGE